MRYILYTQINHKKSEGILLLDLVTDLCERYLQFLTQADKGPGTDGAGTSAVLMSLPILKVHIVLATHPIWNII